MITITLPLPPTINHYYVRSSRTIFLNKKANEFRKEVFILSRNFSNYFSINERLLIDVIFHPPNKRKFDIDNRLKGLLDALQHARIFPDDEQIDKIIVTRGDIMKNGASLITIKKIYG